MAAEGARHEHGQEACTDHAQAADPVEAKMLMADMLLRFLDLIVPSTGLGFAADRDVADNSYELTAAINLRTACMMWICFQ